MPLNQSPPTGSLIRVYLCLPVEMQNSGRKRMADGGRWYQDARHRPNVDVRPVAEPQSASISYRAVPDLCPQFFSSLSRRSKRQAVEPNESSESRVSGT
jgi:hypothetical protein